MTIFAMSPQSSRQASPRTVEQHSSLHADRPYLSVPLWRIEGDGRAAARAGATPGSAAPIRHGTLSRSPWLDPGSLPPLPWFCVATLHSEMES